MTSSPSADSSYLAAEGLTIFVALDCAQNISRPLDRKDKMLVRNARRTEIVGSVTHISRCRIENYISVLKFSDYREIFSRPVGEITP